MKKYTFSFLVERHYLCSITPQNVIVYHICSCSVKLVQWSIVTERRVHVQQLIPTKTFRLNSGMNTLTVRVELKELIMFILI